MYAWNPTTRISNEPGRRAASTEFFSLRLKLGSTKKFNLRVRLSSIRFSLQLPSTSRSSTRRERKRVIKREKMPSTMATYVFDCSPRAAHILHSDQKLPPDGHHYILSHFAATKEADFCYANFNFVYKWKTTSFFCKWKTTSTFFLN